MPASPFDPLSRLDPGEDRFVLREKDPCGPPTVTEWARLRRNRALKLYGMNPPKGGDARLLLDAELAQCAEAEEKALAWSERQQGHAEAHEERATYSGAVQSEEQVSAAKRQKLAGELDRHLAEADACAAELLSLDGPAASPELAEQSAAIHALVMRKYEREAA